MKRFARIFIFLFAVAVIVAILVHWKKNDRENALAYLKESLGADVSITEDGFFIGCSSPRIRDLVTLAETAARIGDVTMIDLTGASSLETFEGAQLMPGLETLVAIDCPKLTDAKGLTGHPVLSDLALTDSANFSDATAIRDIPELRTVDLSGCIGVESIDLSTLPNLENAYFSRCRNLTGIDVSSVPKLKQLYLDGCAGLEEIHGLANLTNLTDLDVSNATSLKAIDGFASLANLIVLDLRNVELESFEEIGKLPSLRVLRLGGQSMLETLEPFKDLTTLREIHLEACPEFRSLEGLPESVSQYAGFSHCPKLSSLAGIEAASGLEQLDLRGCTNLKGIGEVRTLRNLVQLNLVQCRQVTDITPIVGLENLVIVMLGGSGVVPASVEDLEPANKELIFDFSVAE